MILSWISKQENSPSSHLSLTLLLIVYKKQEFLLENSNIRIKTQRKIENKLCPLELLKLCTYLPHCHDEAMEVRL